MKKIKLTNLSRKKLSSEKMNNFRGGDYECHCSCYYANNEGSSIQDNAIANAYGGGLRSIKKSSVDLKIVVKTNKKSL